MNKKVLVIIPSYNEKDNIKTIIDLVFVQEPIDGFTLNVLVVDDNSPDGTSDIVSGMIENTYPDALFMIKRKGKLGLGTAYIKGFKWAIENNYDYVFEMDADLSHNPTYLKDFLKLTEEADLVLGTRYMKNGGVVNWGKHRILLSRGGTTYARLMLGLPYRDLTGGYKCFSIDVLKTIDLDSILSNGYVFQIELTYRAHLLGFRIKETPIVFHDRVAGKSKLSNTIFTEAIKNVILLRMRKKSLKSQLKNEFAVA